MAQDKVLQATIKLRDEISGPLKNIKSSLKKRELFLKF